jgi:ankyrin repeat protein
MGTLLLHESCKEIPDLKKAEGLIKSGADLNLIDRHGFSALMWAVTKCHDALADAIIQSSTLPEEEAN